MTTVALWLKRKKKRNKQVASFLQPLKKPVEQNIVCSNIFWFVPSTFYEKSDVYLFSELLAFKTHHTDTVL